MQAPDLPAAVPVSLDPATTAVLILDISDATTKQLATMESVPAVKRLVDAARGAGARLIFSLGRAAEQEIAPELEPTDAEWIVRSSADKFFNTDLDKKLDGIATVVVVGTAANGAVLYTSFGANARGLTVVVPEDGISSRDPFATYVARYQLLN